MRASNENSTFAFNRISVFKKDIAGGLSVFVIGFVGVLVLALATMTDLAYAHLYRLALQSHANSAALAGSQAADIEQLYENPFVTELPLDEKLARKRTADMLGVSKKELPGLVVEEISPDKTGVHVRLSAEIELPFSAVFIGKLKIYAQSYSKSLIVTE